MDIREASAALIRERSASWLAYFQSNVQSSLDMPWADGAKLTAEQKEWLLPSLRAFQKGEGSEGHNLKAASRRYSEAAADPDYFACTDLFIKEEQKHSAFLALYLKDLGVPVILSTWTDTVFRSLRKGLSLHVSISVLIVAEIIAIGYYDAVDRATNCTLLSKICQRILADERQHVIFQSERIGFLRARLSWPMRMLSTFLHTFLYMGACTVVWVAYRKPYQKAGYTLTGYIRMSIANWSPCAAQPAILPISASDGSL